MSQADLQATKEENKKNKERNNKDNKKYKENQGITDPIEEEGAKREDKNDQDHMVEEVPSIIEKGEAHQGMKEEKG